MNSTTTAPGWWAQPLHAKRRHYFPGKGKNSRCGLWGPTPPPSPQDRGIGRCHKCGDSK